MKLNRESLLKTAMASMNMIFVSTGIGLIGYGAWLIYPAAAFIVVGAAVGFLGLPDKK